MLNISEYIRLSREAEDDETKNQDNEESNDSSTDDEVNDDAPEDMESIDFNTNTPDEGDNNETQEEDTNSEGDSPDTTDSADNSDSPDTTNIDNTSTDDSNTSDDVPADEPSGDTSDTTDSNNLNSGDTVEGDSSESDNTDELDNGITEPDTKVEFNTNTGPDENKEAVTDVVVDLTKEGENNTSDITGNEEEYESIEQESYKYVKLAVEEAKQQLELINSLLKEPSKVTPISAAIAVETFKHIARKAGLKPNEIISLNMISRESLDNTPSDVLTVIKEDLKEIIAVFPL